MLLNSASLHHCYSSPYGHLSLKVPNVKFDFNESVRHCLLSTHTSKLNLTLGTFSDICLWSWGLVIQRFGCSGFNSFFSDLNRATARIAFSANQSNQQVVTISGSYLKSRTRIDGKFDFVAIVVGGFDSADDCADLEEIVTWLDVNLLSIKRRICTIT